MGFLKTALIPVKVAVKPVGWLITDHQKIKHNKKVAEMNRKLKRQKQDTKSKVAKVKAKVKTKAKAKAKTKAKSKKKK